MHNLVRLFSCLCGLLVSLPAAAQTARDFADGIGYYVQTDGTYKILNKQSNLGTTGLSLSLKQVLDIEQPFAMDVSRNFRLFTYGTDFRTQVIPANNLITYCAFTPDLNDNPPESLVHGPFPARIQPIQIPGGIFSGGELPIYEIIPTGIRNATEAEISSAGPKMFFSLNLQVFPLNLQDSCDRGWTFKFKQPQQPPSK